MITKTEQTNNPTAEIENGENSPQSNSCRANERDERVISHVEKDDETNNTNERNSQETAKNTQESG